MTRHIEISENSLRSEIKQGKILLGGNAKLAIYGKLDCRSGKRMKKKNRVFFIDEQEAVQMGYRPCGHCMKGKYQSWQTGQHNSTF